MNKRMAWARALVVLSAVACGTGCDTHRWATRDDQDSKSGNANADSSKVIGGDPSSSGGFFKNNRLSGGWSSQARDIERDLGVGN